MKKLQEPSGGQPYFNQTILADPRPRVAAAHRHPMYHVLGACVDQAVCKIYLPLDWQRPERFARRAKSSGINSGNGKRGKNRIGQRESRSPRVHHSPRKQRSRECLEADPFAPRALGQPAM